MDKCIRRVSNKKYLEDLLKAWIIHEAMIKDEKHLLQLDELDEFKLNGHENAKAYNKGTRRWNDKHVLRKEFWEGDMILFCNSRLKFFPKKLMSRWSRPFKVIKVFSNGIIKV